MASGVQVFNADGSLQFDTTNRLFRVLTLEDIGGAASGSRTVAAQGAVQVVTQPASETGDPPAVTVSGNTVNWNYGSASTRQATRIIIMEY